MQEIYRFDNFTFEVWSIAINMVHRKAKKHFTRNVSLILRHIPPFPGVSQTTVPSALRGQLAAILERIVIFQMVLKTLIFTEKMDMYLTKNLLFIR